MNFIMCLTHEKTVRESLEKMLYSSNSQLATFHQILVGVHASDQRSLGIRSFVFFWIVTMQKKLCSKEISPSLLVPVFPILFPKSTLFF